MHLAAHPGVGVRRAVEAAGGRLAVVPNALWLSHAATFDAWAAGRRGLRLDAWYWVERRRSGWLMDDRAGRPAHPGDQAARPAGGAWSFDVENRRVPPPGHRFPPPPALAPHAITHEVMVEVAARFRTHRLPESGPYEDALVDGERMLAHSLLSVPLSLGLLTAAEA